MLRIAFLGTGDIGLPSLEALLSKQGHDHEVVAVVTQPDKPVGRKQVLTPPEVKVRALAAGVPVLQPERIRNEVEKLKGLQADVFVVIAYGQILPRTVLEIPRLGCLNVHASLLPRHRGASPIQAAIREGDAETGVTIMWMDEGLDTGDILLPVPIAIDPSDTGGVLHDKLAALAPEGLLRALAMVEQGTAPRIKQNDALSTHSRKLERVHGKLDWTRPAKELALLIRAYNPWPGTYCLLPAVGGAPALQLKVHQAGVVPDAEACPTPGTILRADDHLLVSCGQGVLDLTEVQLEGRKRMSARDFLQGRAAEVGMVLA
ncbi:methionyl-tRNA formyltransferase [Roseimicrobium gellanilyticum]|uniref:Methionyl-tRNA formyltransferase n=1 Tax=Roseimicrobium gellanilyticum TaxID=748857 RepID=A0A366H8J0_9BACT|nr:methionyl-tRNA formyltransferase [Roseimicrobium gellanilyticum]RBP38549.1 methionyl-tRNA formyltransferase [Roseimicrobium gellanilyticum]